MRSTRLQILLVEHIMFVFAELLIKYHICFTYVVHSLVAVGMCAPVCVQLLFDATFMLLCYQ